MYGHFPSSVSNVIGLFCPLQYPEAKNHLSLLSLTGTGSEEEEQVMTT